MKTCSKCGEVKDEREFNKRKTAKDGLYCWCKNCVLAYDKQYREHNRDKVTLLHYKQNSKSRGYVWALTDEQALELFSLPCYYCGEAGGGIDRYKNAIGYILENCVPCCAFDNYAKGTVDGDEYIAHINKVANHQRQKALFVKPEVAYVQR